MWWEYYGSETIYGAALTAILMFIYIHFMRTKSKRKLTVPLSISTLGYISFVIGIVFIRGWNGMGWIVYGVIIMVTGLVSYLGVSLYKRLVTNG